MRYQQHFTERELKILNERAARVRHPVENNRAASAMPLIYIWLGQEVYAMPMAHLLSVYQDVSVIPMPCVPAFIAGVANIRGRVMSVIDLARLLNVSELSPDSPSKDEGYVLIVASMESQEIVFRVSRISDGSIAADTILKPLTGGFNIPYPEFVAGLLPDGTPQLDVYAILTSPVIVVNDSIENTVR